MVVPHEDCQMFSGVAFKVLYLAITKEKMQLKAPIFCKRYQEVCVNANVAPVGSIIWCLRRKGTKELVKILAQNLGFSSSATANWRMRHCSPISKASGNGFRKLVINDFITC